MNDQSRKFRLGVFVLGTAILLAMLIILFGEFPMLFSRQFTYLVKFPQAPGVEEGTPVRKSGVRIGQVASIDLNPDTGEVTIKVVVDRKYQLRLGDQAILSGAILIGETAVNFEPEHPDRRPAPEGHVFVGRTPADLRQALGKATDLAKVAVGTMEEIELLSKNVREMLPEIQVMARNVGRAAERIEVQIQGNEARINRALENFADVTGRAVNLLSDDNQKNFAATLKNLRAASDSLETISKKADALVTETQKTMQTIGERVDVVGKNADGLITDARGTLKQFNQTLARSDEVLANLQQVSKPLAERAPQIVKNLEEGTGRFNEIAMNVGEFSRALGEPASPLRRFVSDPAMYNNINDAVANLNKSMKQLDKIMRDVSVFADKIARHPETLGIGGAVNPSSGLKEGGSRR